MFTRLFSSASTVTPSPALLSARGTRRVVDVFADEPEALPPMRVEEVFVHTSISSQRAAVRAEVAAPSDSEPVPEPVEPAARKGLPTMMQGVIRNGRVEVNGMQKFPEGTTVRIIRQ